MPCTLPCAGIALNRGYRFWLPDADPRNPYEGFAVREISFSVDAAPGKTIPLTDKIGPIIRANPPDLTDASFPKTVKSWLSSINNIIASEPLLNQVGKGSWLTLGYEPMGPGRLGTLTIEHFECLDFNIQLTVTIARSGPPQSLKLSYRPGGTTIEVVGNDAISRVPPFEGTRIDKCDPRLPVERLCPNPPDVTLTIDAGRDGRTVNLRVTPSRRLELIYLWEVEAAVPPFGNGVSFTTTFPGTDSNPKRITVTGYTKEGCTVTQSMTITVEGGLPRRRKPAQNPKGRL